MDEQPFTQTDAPLSKRMTWLHYTVVITFLLFTISFGYTHWN